MTTPTRAIGLALPILLTAFVAHAGDRWKDADSDGDGRVSRTEAEAVSPRFAEHFAKVDQDADGYLTSEELQASRKERGSRYREHAKERFSSADTDQDGALNLAETQVAFPKLAENFAELDTDNDGKLTPRELHAARHDRHAERADPAAAATKSE
jgi:hypothetical protein